MNRSHPDNKTTVAKIIADKEGIPIAHAKAKLAFQPRGADVVVTDRKPKKKKDNDNA